MLKRMRKKENKFHNLG